jgi:hypothetical protein
MSFFGYAYVPAQLGFAYVWLPRVICYMMIAAAHLILRGFRPLVCYCVSLALASAASHFVFFDCGLSPAISHLFPVLS